MLTNLFSMFDMNLFLMNPLFILLMFMILLMMLNNFFLCNFNTNTLYILFTNQMLKQFNNELLSFKKNKNINTKSKEKFFMVLLIFLLLMNFFSLLPMVMSLTSHISINLTMAFSLWSLSIICAMKISWKNFFSHMTPFNTPMMLMSFMVIIETISNLIRPLTLAVRLMANMVAGHLLMMLLSKFSLTSQNNFFLANTMLMPMLIILETGVSFIQSYVFTLLILLYFKENFN